MIFLKKGLHLLILSSFWGCSWAAQELTLEIERQDFRERALDLEKFGIHANADHLREAYLRWPTLSGPRLQRRAILLSAFEKDPKRKKMVLSLGSDRKSDLRALELYSEFLTVTARN